MLNQDRIKRDVIVIGASAGGVSALALLFNTLPSQMNAVIGVVLHRGTEKGHLADVLGRKSALPIIEPDERMPLRPAHIYLGPPDQHLLFERDRISLHRGPKEHGTRPAIDPLFRSAAAAFGRRVTGVLLTGCGEDGVSGLIAVSRSGGMTLAQDPDEAYMPYLPLNALKFDDLQAVIRLESLASVLAALAAGQTLPARRGKVA